MAQRIQTLFIDDIDGGPAEGTVRFGLDGTDYSSSRRTTVPLGAFPLVREAKRPDRDSNAGPTA